MSTPTDQHVTDFRQDKPTSRCQTKSLMRTLIRIKPVIPWVAFIRYINFKVTKTRFHGKWTTTIRINRNLYLLVTREVAKRHLPVPFCAPSVPSREKIAPIKHPIKHRLSSMHHLILFTHYLWMIKCLSHSKIAIHHFRPYQILTPWSFTGSFCPKTHVRISSPHILFHHYLPARQLPIRCIFHAGRHLSDKEICYLGTITVMADVFKKVPFVRVQTGHISTPSFKHLRLRSVYLLYSRPIYLFVIPKFYRTYLTISSRTTQLNKDIPSTNQWKFRHSPHSEDSNPRQVDT